MPMTEITRRRGYSIVLMTAVLAAFVVAVPGSSLAAGSVSQAVPADTVVVAQSADPTTMDPQQQRDTPTFNVLSHFYDPLLMRDTADPRKFDPVLATSWKVISPTDVQFKLHTGVHFSDGSAFNAETVKYNVDRILGTLPGEKTQPLASYQYASLKGAKVVNDSTVDILTKTPDPLLLARMSALLMVPTNSVTTNPKALSAKPDGTGPYTLVTWDRNNEVAMKANPNYFRGAPKIANVIFKDMPDDASRLAALEAGDVDVISNLPPDNIKDAESTGKATAEIVPSDRIVSIWLDTLDVAQLKSPLVRQALNYAVDVPVIISKLMDGYALRTANIVPPYFAGFDAAVKPFPYNPTKAKQLLAKAGYPNGFTITMMVPAGRYLLGTEIAEAVAGYLGKVGVNTKVDIVDFGVFAKDTDVRKIPPTFFAAWGENFFNPVDEMQVAIQCGTKGFSWYCNKSVDKAINTAADTLNTAKEEAALASAQKQLQADPAFIYLFAYKDLYGVSNQLNWKPRSDELIYMYEASLKP
jgi:peptide/nickel transport system substrate-binding protein